MFSIEEIKKFHQNGIIIAKNLINDQELNYLKKASLSIVDNALKNTPQTEKEYNTTINNNTHLYHKNNKNKYIYRRTEKMWERDDIFKAVTVNPKILICYGQLIGHSFMPMHDSLVCKIPEGNVPINWHQDPPYNLSLIHI